MAESGRYIWFVLAVLLTGVSACGGSSSTGRSQRVAVAADPALSNALVGRLVFVDDAPAVVYYDDSEGAIRAAWPDGASWATELIETSAGGAGIDGIYLAAATDASGRIHIAYRDADAANVRYIVGTKGSWSSSEPLPPGDDRGRGLDLVVDQGGNPWIAYRNETTQALEVVHLSEGVWQLERVDSDGNTGLWPVMDRDPGGRVSVAYRNASENAVRLAQFETVGSWNVVTVETATEGVLGRWIGLSLGPPDALDLSTVYPRVLYTVEDVRGIRLRYAEGTGGVWTAMDVDRRLFGGSDNCIAVGPSGRTWATFLDQSALDLKIGLLSGGSWRTATLDDDGATGFWSDCLADSTGALHVVYTRRGEGVAELRYAVTNRLR